MKLWKIVQDGGCQVMRSIPVPDEVESREDILDVLGLSDLAGTGSYYIYPSGFYRDGKRMYDITVFTERSVVIYTYTH